MLFRSIVLVLFDSSTLSPSDVALDCRLSTPLFRLKMLVPAVVPTVAVAELILTLTAPETDPIVADPAWTRTVPGVMPAPAFREVIERVDAAPVLMSSAEPESVTLPRVRLPLPETCSEPVVTLVDPVTVSCPATVRNSRADGFVVVSVRELTV